MNKTKSKIYFVVLTALLVGGMPNLLIQDAYAVVPLMNASSTATTTTMTLNFSQNVYNAGGDGNITECLAVTNPTRTITGVTAIPTVDGGAAISTVTVTVSVAMPTDATPTITYDSAACGGTINHNDGVGGASIMANGENEVLTDGVVPTFVSAETASSTTITLTMSEDVTNDSAVNADFTIGGLADGTTTINNIVVSGSTITLTTVGTISSADSPTVSYTRNGNVIDDGATGNILATFGAQTVTNNESTPTGSGCDDCESPTLGVNSKSKRIVENGFTYNGKPTDAERFFTPYPLITATVGKQNTAVFKIYEDNGPENIKHFSFAFGLDKGQYIGESKAMIELDIDHEGTETVTVTDPENALDNVKVSTNIANCNGDDSGTQCLIVTIDHRFRAPLDFNIVGTDVWDMQRNSWQNYFNHGIEVTGESLNPAKKYDGIDAGHVYHLTETSKTTAVDEFGNMWSFQYGIWMKDYVKNVRVSDSTSISDRLHPNFADYKELQIQYAITTLLESCSTCLTSYDDFDDSFVHSYPDTINKLDNPEILQKMILENERAQVIMNYLLDPMFHLK